MQRTVIVNNRAIVYVLERKAVKNINLRVRLDGSVYVSANSRVPLADIERFVCCKADFILRAQLRYRELATQGAGAVKIADGRKIKIFGEEKILSSRSGNVDAVEEIGNAIVLTLKDASDAAHSERTLTKYLHARCEQTIKALCKLVFPVFSRYGVSFPQIKFRSMRSRWGSCTPTRHKVTFNYALVSAPTECVEYVVVHEFCHFLHPDHSSAFHACLTAVMPDWKQRKKLLNATCTTF